MRRIAIIALALSLVATRPAAAQYFGRNKVQSAHFDFQIFETPHFDLYYYPAERDAAVLAGRLAERWYARLSAALDHQFLKRQPIILYASHSHFTQTTVLADFIPEGVGGFTDHLGGRIVLPLSPGLAETDHVLGHELVHAFQRDILKRRGQSLAMLPLWFAEGMAEYLSVGPLDNNTRMWLRDAALAEHLPTLGQLGDPKWFPYRYGQALWTFLAERYGRDIAHRALLTRGKGGAVGRIRSVTGASTDELTRDWHTWIRRVSAVAPTAAATKPVAAAPIVTAESGGHLNVGPSLSPDGASIVFLSERDGLSVDVFLANAVTGAVTRKLLSTATDPHFDSLQFLDSAGAWNPNGREFVLGAVRDGEAVLTVLDIVGGGGREIVVPGVDQVYSPTWSADGARIAFSAMRGGVTDLFVMDLASGSLRAITADAFSDLQPSFSPDGRSLVFATDRFTSAPESLAFGSYRLALVDLASGAVWPIASNATGKNIDPHWTPDGRSVLFLSDPDGTTNIYRSELESGAITRVTDVPTGVSGITALSPALSIAQRDSRLMFSVYRHGGYELHALELEAPTTIANVAASLPARTTTPAIAPGPLDPLRPVEGTTFPTRAYVPTLSLAGIGQPYMSAGGGAFGSFLRAGTSLSFGDMLGQQRLETAIQAGKSLMDFAVQGAYENRRSRWTWGLAAGQVPAISGEFQGSGPGLTAEGNATTVRVARESQQIHRQLSGVVAYPFSHAQRIEFTAGFDRVTFAERTTTTIYAAASGRVLDETTASNRSAPSAAVFESGMALVYDAAVLGATSPILGQRYRFAVAPSFGDVTFITTIADYRRYFMPVKPVTFAFRAEHVGRFGNGASDPRLLPLVWTVRDIVRGYDDTSAGLWSTQQFAALNGEIRIPIPGVFRRQLRPSALPLEAIGFGDWGRFWAPRAGPSASVANLASVGGGIRLNAAGFVFEFDGARTLTNVGAPSGWKFAVNFRPGF